MANIKLTKSELKTQKDKLKQFERYLPTLTLKKQQLQSVITSINNELEQKVLERSQLMDGIEEWVSVVAENTIFPEELKIENLVQPDKVECDIDNIAGVKIPVFRELTFKEIVYDVSDYPLWVDFVCIKLREIARLDALVTTLKKQSELLGNELRTTSQRVNLFERVKIPEAKENIRKIGIYLGDQQTSAVVRGKIAKKKTLEALQ